MKKFSFSNVELPLDAREAFDQYLCWNLTKGFGKANPVAPNTHPDGSDNPEDRARNRRVEIIIPTR